MQVKAKSNSVVTSKELGEGRLEVTVLGAGPLDDHGRATNLVRVFNVSKVHADNIPRATMRGFNQRLINCAALPRDTRTGKSATAADKAAAVWAMMDHYESGSADWSPARAALVGGARLDPVILAAVVEVLGLTTAQVRERVAKGAEKNSVTQAAYLEGLTQNRKVADAVARIRKAAPKPDMDADAELDAMMEGGDDTDE